MSLEMPLTEARERLSSLPRRLGTGGTLAVTKRGRKVLAVLPWDLYESIVETLEILGDRKLMAELGKGIADAEAGAVVSWRSARKKLDV